MENPQQNIANKIQQHIKKESETMTKWNSFRNARLVQHMIINVILPIYKVGRLTIPSLKIYNTKLQ